MANAALAPLRHRSFALALTSSFVSSIGTWMQSVALGYYLYHTTRNPVWLGVVTMAAWLPSIIASPVGGAVADRWSRQRWIQYNNMVMAACASTLAACALTNNLSPKLIVAMALVEGLSGAGSWAAWQSLLRDLVEPDEVLAAVSLSSAQFNLGRILGPAAAGIALGFGSVGWCFAFNAGTFVFVTITFAFVRSRPRPHKTTPFRLFSEIAEGARAAWGNEACRHAIVTVAIVAMILSPFISLVPAMAIGVLHGGKTGTTWLVTAQGVGAVIGAFTLPNLARRTSRLTVLRLSLITLTVAVGLYGLAPTLWWAVGALVVVGMAYIGTLNGLNASVQLHAPTAERSRILSLYTLSLSVFYPFGALIQSSLAKNWGVRTVTVASAAVAGCFLVGILVLRPRYLRVMGATAAAA